VDDDTTDRSAKGPAERPTQRPRPQKSLLARALSSLARREHSRAELRRKLAPYAEDVGAVDRLLDELQAKKLLSDERFVEVVKRSRGERFGTARIKQELKAHQLDDQLVRAAVDDLKQTELARAKAVWQRRFGTAAADPAEGARQMRFLAQRGFSTEVIIKVVRGGDADE
jgi:regulatory protein